MLRKGTSQHADYDANQGEVNRPSQNYLDLRKTAPTRPATRIRSGTRPPNGTIKSIQKIVCTPSSHLGEVPAWAEGAHTTNKLPSPLGRVPVRVDGQVNMPIMTIIKESSLGLSFFKKFNSHILTNRI